MKIALVTLVVLFALACGGGGRTAGGGKDDGWIKWDTGHDQVDIVEHVDYGQDRNIQQDTESFEGIEIQDRFDADIDGGDTFTPCLGAFLCPCVDNLQCQSNFCIDSPDGRVCTKMCYEETDCPDGWSCRQVTNTQGEPAWVCLPKGVFLCRPCREHKDCTSQSAITDDRCVVYGSQGNYCGVTCGEGKGACPEGYSCQEVPIVGGGFANQCVPDSGQCTCSKIAIDLKASTDCYVANEWGRCTGIRECTESGLGDCSARTPAQEACNNVDDNCDGIVDPEGAKGCTNYYQDNDGDGFGMGVGKCLCKSPGPGYSATPGDCNDASTSIFPGATEYCNGIDDDCDGTPDNAGAVGCTDFLLDNDGDGYGVPGSSKCLCVPSAPYTGDPKKPFDCDDNDKDIHPDSKEVCNGKDDNCDGLTDPENSIGCEPWYYDGDGDGFGSSTRFKCLCAASGSYNTKAGNDCDDNDPSVHPFADELCDGLDNNCNGQTDEGDPTVLCKPQGGIDLHGSVACVDGRCRVVECAPATNDENGQYVPAWFDLDGNFMNGCECQGGKEEQWGGDICENAIDLGEIGEGDPPKLISGKIVPADDEDWYKVKASDLRWNAEINGCDLYNFKVTFTRNPDNTYFIYLRKGSCALGNEICGGSLVTEWATNFSASGKGECPCSPTVVPTCDPPESVPACKEAHGGSQDYCNSCPGYAEPGKNLCADNTDFFYIVVKRNPTKPPICDTYEIEVSNGRYPWSGQ